MQRLSNALLPNQKGLYRAMRLVSINVGKAERIEHAGKSGETGIYKRPTEQAVRVTVTGLEGDAICDTDNHGGADQAVYVYGSEDYLWWSKELGYELTPGRFGENLTLSDMESGGYRIGDRFHLAEVILEVTAPRIPCGTLAARMDDRDFPLRFKQAERPGLYCRVIREGSVQAGEPITVEPYAGETVSAIEMFRSFYRKDQDEATLRRFLAAPIAVRARTYMDKQLRKLLE